jgi:iron complex outermembrane receptor protein
MIHRARRRPGLLLGAVLAPLLAASLPAMGHPSDGGGRLPVATLTDDLQFIKEEDGAGTAVPRESPDEATPTDVAVLTEEDIRRSGAGDLPTLLRYAAGLEATRTGSDGGGKLLVLINGRLILRDAQGAVNWTLLPVTLPEIERIEVSHGPAAGASAFDRLINIITKTPAG